jgi:hypothetical protein
MVMCPGCILFPEELEKLIYSYDTYLNRLGDCGDINQVWDCISAS